MGIETRLLKVVFNQDINTVEHLLFQKGVNPDVKDQHQTTALIHAVKGSPKIVQLLLKAGADVNSQNIYGNTALINAVSGESDRDTLLQLIEAGADLNAKTMLGRTALIEAVMCRNVIAVQILVDAGADIWVRDDHQENATKKAIKSQQTQIARLLFNAAFDALYHSSKLA